MTKITAVKLENPITRKSGTDKIEIDSIDVRKPSASDLRGIGLTDFAEMKVDAILSLLPRVANPAITIAEAETLSVGDLFKIGGALMGEDTDNPTAGNADTSPKP